MSTQSTDTDRAGVAQSDEPTVAAALQALSARIDSMADVIESLRPLVALAEQAPAMVAIAGDSFDEVMRSAIDRGIDVERGLLNGAEAALRFGATMDAEKVRALESLLQSGVLDPAALRTVGELGRALVDTASVPPPAIGPMGLLKALGRPDVQRALGFLVTFAERFGSRLREPQPPRS
jgi:uncharacterized protein YjgD (DUF1641 family)